MEDTDRSGEVSVPSHPLVLEVDTWPWLTGLARSEGRPVDLGSVPASVWDAIAEGRYDLVWLMGVWKRSPAGVARALGDPELLRSFRVALPDYTEEDVVGSPYCIRDYVVDQHLGGPAALATARAELRVRGIGLVLDFVPNHVAPDHPWISERPDRFVLGEPADLQQDPATFVHLAGCVFAHGQTTGRRTHLPVFLGRFPDEPHDADLDAFYQRLLDALADPTFCTGEWRWCPTLPWADDPGTSPVLCWSWTGDTRWLVAVNLSERACRTRVTAPWPDLTGRPVRLHDPTQDVTYDRTGEDLNDGVYVELPPWGWHLFRVADATAASGGEAS